MHVPDPFLLLCRAHKLPAPQTEFRFLPDRKFRADYCWPEAMVIVEQHGGIWKKGAHSSGLGLLRDFEKSNLAQMAGYLYLTFTPQQLQLEATFQTLKTILCPQSLACRRKA